jgi:hypothetical protein
MAEERKEAQPTERVLLMEFQVPSENAREWLPDAVFDALIEQMEDRNLPDPLTLLIPVGESEGGPKHVIENEARVRGRFRAIARESYDQGHEAIPPEQQKFELKPL